MQQVKEALSQLVKCPDEEWDALESILQEKEVKKGEFLISAGSPCKAIYFIREGLFRKYYIENGNEKIRQFFFENGFVTEFESLITGAPATLFVQAVESSKLYVMPKDKLYALYDKYKNFERLGRLVAEYQFVGFAQRFTKQFNQSVEEQYLDLIKTRPKVIQRIPQYMIASYLGITPEAFSRIKKRLAEKNM